VNGDLFEGARFLLSFFSYVRHFGIQLLYEFFDAIKSRQPTHNETKTAVTTEVHPNFFAARIAVYNADVWSRGI